MGEQVLNSTKICNKELESGGVISSQSEKCLHCPLHLFHLYFVFHIFTFNTMFFCFVLSFLFYFLLILIKYGAAMVGTVPIKAVHNEQYHCSHYFEPQIYKCS